MRRRGSGEVDETGTSPYSDSGCSDSVLDRCHVPHGDGSYLAVLLTGKLLRSSIAQWLELHARFRARLPELKSQLSHPGGSIRIPFS